MVFIKSLFYRDYEISHSMIRTGEYTVTSYGEDFFFSSIKEAKIFIDSLY